MKRFALTKRLRAFTLVEMMMSSILAIIVIIFLVNFFLNALLSKQSYLFRQDLNYNMDFALHQISYQIKQAVSIDTVSSVFGSHPGTLVFDNAIPSQSPLTISSDGNNLTLSRGAEGPYSLLSNTNQVTNLTFDYQTPNNSTGIVSGSLTLQSLLDSDLSLSKNFSITLRTNN